MPNVSLDSLLHKAKKLEKNYDWMSAAELYAKARELYLQAGDSPKAAGLMERVGFCFYRAAYQAQTNDEFRERMKQSIQAYEKEIQILRQANQSNVQVRINQAKALLAYTQSRYETSPQKRKELLDDWWALEHQVLKSYESIGDSISVGKTCNDLIEFWTYDLCWLTKEFSIEQLQIDELKNLSEKAIQILSKLDDDYELARAYCLATWHYSWAEWEPQSANKTILFFRQKCNKYSKEALEIAEKTGDAWLISWSYASAWMAAQFCNMNPELSIEYGKKSLEYARVAEDNWLMGFANDRTSASYCSLARCLEDPDKQKESFKKAIEMAQKGSEQCTIIDHIVGIGVSASDESNAIMGLAAIEPNLKTKQTLLEKALERTREGIKKLKGYDRISGALSSTLSSGLRLFSAIQSEIEEKRKILNDALFQAKKHLIYLEELVPFQFLSRSETYYELALVYDELAEITINQSEKIELLSNATVALDKCTKLIAEKRAYLQTGWAVGYYFGQSYFKLGDTLRKLHALTKEEKTLFRAVEAYKQASLDYGKAEMPTHVAESYWHTAQLKEELGKHQEAAENYELAAEAYDLAAKKITQLNGFYEDYSCYMRAWSQIEQAKQSHSIEDYVKAKDHYEKAAGLHASTEPWSYLDTNYQAWANVEEAENLSRNENTQQAKQEFQKALEQFAGAEESIKRKMEGTASTEEEALNQKLLQALGLRLRFCQARIGIEEAKLLDRQGKYLQSSKSYEEAGQNIFSLIEKVESEAERNEMEYLAVLCQAWGKMAVAEETASSESYLEAARLFEKAKEHCYTKKASLWALGNSSFCKGLAAGLRYRSSMDLKENALAKRYVKDSASSYFEAGFTSASEYAKATLRLFDAYVFVNQAESEVDPEKKTRQYQMAENLLQIAAGSFMKAKQPEKTAQVQRILRSVREEKALAVSLSQVMQAPTISSSTLSFTAPSPTSEVSVGLEQFQHANVQANLIAGMKEVKVGESFCLTVEFVNAGKEPALLTKVEDFVPPDFMVVKKPEIYRLEDSCLNLKGKQIAPLKLVEAKVVLQPSRKGLYRLSPRVHYLDELGRNRSLQLQCVEIRVEEVVLADRVSTGTKELDSILLGGIPKEYAVVLTGSPSDERELIVRNFLEAGTGEGQTSFYVTTEPVGLESLLGKSGFHLFLCNPKPKFEVPFLPNVYKLLGKTDLTNLSIALLKAYRNIEQAARKRICLDIVSDVLLRCRAEATRSWLSELITDLGSKGFTVLAVMDPAMHPTDQATAVLNLFDGEISLSQAEDTLECKKSLRVKKLRNQDFIKNPICLTNPTP